MLNSEEERRQDSQDRLEFKADSDSRAFLGDTNIKGKNSMVPRPPRPGEKMHCLGCGKVMMPDDFSKDIKIRKREFKWNYHQKCMLQMEDLVDRSTPGLMSERKQAK